METENKDFSKHNFLEIFKHLSSLDCANYIEKKEGLNYISWANAWNIISKYYNADYSVREFDGRPYLHDEILGYIVETTVTINGISKSMKLPVMDNKNKSLKSAPYTYMGTTWVDKKKVAVEKTVNQITSFDINTSIMRCLVKNIALFGLGLYVYAGEDIPEATKEAEIEAKQKEMEELKLLVEAQIKDADSREILTKIWNRNKPLQTELWFTTLVTEKAKTFKKEEGENGTKAE
jgi:hypothetical protein